MADVLLPIFLPFEYLTYNNPLLFVCVFRLGFHADSVDCIFIPTWWCEGRGFDPQWRQVFLCLWGFIWMLYAEDKMRWSCTSPPFGLHIWYNPCTIIHVVILVSGLKVHIYWTHVVSTDQGILFVSLSVSFRGFLQTSGVLSWLWEGASVWTLLHETQSAAAVADLLELSISTPGPLGPSKSDI